MLGLDTDSLASASAYAHTKSSGALHALYAVGLNPSRSFTAAPPTPSAIGPAAYPQEDSSISSVFSDWESERESEGMPLLEVPGPIRSALQVLSPSLARLLPLSSTGNTDVSINTNDPDRARVQAEARALLKRLFALLLCSFGAARLSNALLTLARAVLASRPYDSTVLEFLSADHLARAQGQGHAPYDARAHADRKFSAQIEALTRRVCTLEASRFADPSTTALLRATMTRDNGEITWLRGELIRAERRVTTLLFDAGARARERIALEQARDLARREASEARMALAEMQMRMRAHMESPRAEDDHGQNLGALARLQNERLDSCVFAKESELESEGDEEKGKEGGYENEGEKERGDASDDSVVIVNEHGGLQGTPRSVKSTHVESVVVTVCAAPSVSSCIPLPPAPAHISISQPPVTGESTTQRTSPRTLTSIPSSGTNRESDLEGACPIPVYTTPRPSLPPKASKTNPKTNLKPLLLGAQARAVSSSASAHRSRARSMKFSASVSVAASGNGGNATGANSEANELSARVTASAPAT
ncbi:hypothetical protein EW145_g7203, partial [Phellinidium pouzarii]